MTTRTPDGFQPQEQQLNYGSNNQQFNPSIPAQPSQPSSPTQVSATTLPLSGAPTGSQFGSQFSPQQFATNPQLNQWMASNNAQTPAGWQPTQYNQGGGVQIPNYAPTMAPAQAPPSVASQALRTGGAANLQAYLQALKQVGAGGNNAQMSSGPAAPNVGPQYMSNLAGYGGTAGGAQYVGGFNGGNNQTSYNYGLGAQGGGMMAPPTSGFQNVPPGGYQMPAGFGQPSMIGSGGNGYRSLFGTAPNTGYRYNADPTIPPYGQQPQQQSLGFGSPSGMRQAPTGPSSPYSSLSGSTYGPSSSSGLRPTTGLQPIGPIFSDETVKTDVAPADESLRRFLDSYPSKHTKDELREFVEPLGAHEYSYKNPKHGEGRFVSPMAQELEQSKIGKSAVIETPEGKMVHYGRLEGVGFAIDAMHHEQLTDAEKRLDRLEKIYAGLGAAKKRRARG